jgi:hypothetical protein
MNQASAVYCSGTYREPRAVFICNGRCETRRPQPFAAVYHCSDCTLLLLLLARIGVGTPPRDSMLENLVRHNAIVNRWEVELREEVLLSTGALPHLLDNAIQSRGMRVIWGVNEHVEIVGGPAPEHRFVMLGWSGTVMAMHINTGVPGANSFRHRLHIVPHNAGFMLRELILLPFDAAPAHVVNVVERHTLPLKMVDQ